ncbi:hypothetical protein HOY80DRAFT_721969 [Tuber brumale]|nr:hypothetical protein HOY80DRAFT_721969 [Tuber brumale]
MVFSRSSERWRFARWVLNCHTKKKDLKPCCSGFEVSLYSQAYGVSTGMVIHFYFIFIFISVFSSFISFWSGALGAIVICTLPFSFPVTFSFEFSCSNTYPLYTSLPLCSH